MPWNRRQKCSVPQPCSLGCRKKSKEAGHALTRAADSYARHSELTFQAPAQYAEAAKTLRREDPEAAIIALERAAEMSVKCPGACNLQRAGRFRRDQAELYEACGNLTEAQHSLRQAADLFDADGSSSAASQCRLNLANLLALSNELYKARVAYEELVHVAFNADSKAAGGLPCHLLRFRVGLCYLAEGQTEQLEAVLDKFAQEDLAFGESPMHKMLQDLMHALVNSDADAFNKQVRALGDGAGMDKVVTSLLLKTKKAVSRQGEVGERIAQSLAAQDDEELL